MKCGDFPHSVIQLTVRIDILVPPDKTLGEALTSMPNPHITLELANASLLIPRSSYAPHFSSVCHTTPTRQHTNQPEGHTIDKHQHTSLNGSIPYHSGGCLHVKSRPPAHLHQTYVHLCPRWHLRHISCSTGLKQNPCFPPTFHK